MLEAGETREAFARGSAQTKGRIAGREGEGVASDDGGRFTSVRRRYLAARARGKFDDGQPG